MLRIYINVQNEIIMGVLFIDKFNRWAYHFFSLKYPSGKYKKEASLMVCILAIYFCKICCTLLEIVQSEDPATQIKCKAAIDWQQHLNNRAATYSLFIRFVPSLFIHQWFSRHWLIIFSIKNIIVGTQGSHGSIQNS